jgi:hypothetical protein
VVTASRLELEGRSLEPVNSQVLRTRGKTVRTSLLDIDGGDGLGVTSDLTNRGTRVEEEDGTELLATLADYGDTLAVISPSHIRGSTGKHLVLTLLRRPFSSQKHAQEVRWSAATK